MKLENIMMTDDSDVAMPKVVDFGLAKMVGPEETANDLFGTLGYVAPEVLKKETYNKAVDIWSLGVIVYALISGALPYDSDDKKELARQTIEDPVPFDIDKFDDCSKAVKKLIVELLHKDQKKRPVIEAVLMNAWIVGDKQEAAARLDSLKPQNVANKKFGQFATSDEPSPQFPRKKREGGLAAKKGAI